MSDKKPNSRRNLDLAIDRLFGVNSNQLQARTLIANTVIGQLLPNGVVKGGSALKFRYGEKITRFSRNFDNAIYTSDYENAAEIFKCLMASRFFAPGSEDVSPLIASQKN